MAFEIVSGAVTTTGSAGAATGSVTLCVRGYIEWIYFDFHASTPATTDTTVAYANTPPGGNILVLTSTATDVLKFPRAGAVTAANAAITDSNTRFPAWGDVTVSLAEADALATALTVYIGVQR